MRWRFPAESPADLVSRLVRAGLGSLVPDRTAGRATIPAELVSASFAGAIIKMAATEPVPVPSNGGGGVAVAGWPAPVAGWPAPAEDQGDGTEQHAGSTEPTRYEFKMLAENFMVPDIRSWLRVHPIGFRVAHPKRLISSVYFDTVHLERYDENLAGVANRRKVRLRWYGDTDAEARCVFEVKCKRGRVGWKLSQAMSRPLDLTAMGWSAVVRSVRDELSEDLRLFLDFGGLPVLVNRYQREYFCSFDGALRVTLDYDQLYYDQRYAAEPNLRRAHPPIEDAVIEFKAPTSEASRLARVIGELPLRVTRCSKYVRGIETCMGYEPFDV
jgi:hypothetical protein